MEVITKGQYSMLVDLCAAANTEPCTIAAALKLDTLENLPASRFAAVQKRLQEKAAQAQVAA